jgi:hypothetical protein
MNFYEFVMYLGQVTSETFFSLSLFVEQSTSQDCHEKSVCKVSGTKQSLNNQLHLCSLPVISDKLKQGVL